MSCRIIVAENIAVLDYIGKHLLADDGSVDNSILIQQLIWMMENEPQNLLLLTAFEGEEVLGFIIAVSPAGHDHVFIHQCWVAVKSPRELTDLLFLRVIMWARNKGRVELRMETRRDPAAFSRRWGFNPVFTTMSKNISQEYENELIQKLTHETLKGNQNGQEQQTEHNVGVESSTTKDRSAPVTISSTELQPGSESVRGSDSAGPGATVPTESELSKGIQPTAVSAGAKQCGEQSVEWKTELPA